MKLSETAVLIVYFLLAILQKLPSVDFCCCFLQDDWALTGILISEC